MAYKATLLDSGVLYRSGNRLFGYNAWPTVARLDGGRLAVVFSGHRVGHVCPFGKLMLVTSDDEGKSWSAPAILIDSEIDDRDGGILSLGNGRVMATSFAARRSASLKAFENRPDNDPVRRMAQAYADGVIPAEEDAAYHSKYVLSEDNGVSWSEPKIAPVSNPGGPTLLDDGGILYVGNEFARFDRFGTTGIGVAAWLSEDGGESFRLLGQVPTPDYGEPVNFCEVHALSLGGGKVICHIRTEPVKRGPRVPVIPTIHQSVSLDGGKTWSMAKATELDGLPPFLTRLSSGLLLSVYGRRWNGDAVLAAFSADEGETWDANHVIDDYPSTGDMGYPSTVELSDGSLYTVYYCGDPASARSDIRYARWKL